MYGYIYVNEQELKLREFRTYRSFYCGLCQELHRRYGRSGQMVLNYDMTFLGILLTGLYEPETLFEEKRCLVHPVHTHQMADNSAVAYAADMCVLLAYQKAEDDWEDEHIVSSRALAGLLKSGYNKIVQNYPRQGRAVEENIALLHEIEKKAAGAGDRTVSLSETADIDYVSGLTGNFLAELFVWKDDIWQDDLRQIGFYLGKFIYLMDAVEDIDRDRKHGNYNIFSGQTDIWEKTSQEEIYGILSGMMTEASRAFERLPVVEYAPIIRNVLYSGVWCKYADLLKKDQARKEKIKEKEKTIEKTAENEK